MTQRVSLKLNLRKKLLLLAVALVAIAMPVAIGLASPPKTAAQLTTALKSLIPKPAPIELEPIPTNEPQLTLAPIATLPAPMIAMAEPDAMPSQPLAQAKPPTATAPAKLQFDVASVKQNIDPNAQSASNVNMISNDTYVPTGGVFRATNYPLFIYIRFAYRLNVYLNADMQKQLQQLPDWVSKDKFDIEAKTDKKDVTKDELRMMVRSLLEDRFKMVAHREVRQMPAYGLVLAKPGKFGPHLRPHPADGPPCSPVPEAPDAGPARAARPSASELIDGLYPPTCGDIVGLGSTTPFHIKVGGRAVTMSQIAFTSQSGTQGIDHAVLDETGLKGTFDYVIEFISDPLPGGKPRPDGWDDGGPHYIEALNAQLGLKLVPHDAPMENWIVDHIDHPTPN